MKAAGAIQTVRALVYSSGPGEWYAYFDGRPESAVGGDTPTSALNRLMRSTADADYISARVTGGSTAVGKLEFTLTVRQPRQTCPDCGGSGRYVGLTLVEPCRRCSGSGMVSRQPPT